MVAKPRTSFSELISFLSGFFEVWQETVVCGDAIKTLTAELERVGDGLPPRYQELFFELTSALDSYEDISVNVAVVKEAMALHRQDFPPSRPT